MAAIDRGRMRPQQIPAATPPTAPQGQVPQAQEFVPWKLEMPDDLDESVTKPFQSVVEQMNRQMQQMHKMRQHTQVELQAMNLLRQLDDYDRFIGGLGEEWQKHYGVGSTVDMDPQSAEFQERMKGFHGGKGLQADAISRRQQMTQTAGWLRSHRADNWDRIAEMERTRINGKVDARKAQFGERPTKGKEPAMSPREEAEAVWRK